MTKENSQNKMWHWAIDEIGVAEIWTHGLIDESVRVSERNSVVADSNPT